MRFSEEKTQFIESMIDKIHNIPLQIIIGSRINLVHKGRHYMGLCPFHRDNHLGSFLVTPDKGLWSCFTCGDDYSGDAISFVSKFENITWIEAAYKIALEENIITQVDYDKYSRQKVSKKIIQRITEKNKAKKPDPVIQDPNVNDKVYTAFASFCPLSAKHKQHLLTERMLTEERLSDYFTFPCYGKEKIISKLYKSLPWLTQDMLIKVPGFFFDKKIGKVTYAGYKGIGILIKDVPYNSPTGKKQKVLAIQIRKDTVSEGEQRYVWMSSSFAQYDTEKYIGGCGCGSLKDVLTPETINPEINYSVFITEGKFKSEKIVSYGNDKNISVSVQGVSSWNGIEKVIEKLKSRLKVGRLLIAFDADMMINPAVYKHSKDMAAQLKTSTNIPVKYLLWRLSEGKGIDDLLIAGHGANVKLIETESFNKLYDEVFHNTLNRFTGFDPKKTIRDIPKESLEEFYSILRLSLENKIFSKEVTKR